MYLWSSYKGKQFHQKLLHLFVLFMTNPRFFRIVLVTTRRFASGTAARYPRGRRTGGCRSRARANIRSTTSTTIAAANSTRATSGTGTPETGAFWKRKSFISMMPIASCSTSFFVVTDSQCGNSEIFKLLRILREINLILMASIESNSGEFWHFF